MSCDKPVERLVAECRWSNDIVLVLAVGIRCYLLSLAFNFLLFYSFTKGLNRVFIAHYGITSSPRMDQRFSYVEWTIVCQVTLIGQICIKSRVTSRLNRAVRSSYPAFATWSNFATVRSKTCCVLSSVSSLWVHLSYLLLLLRIQPQVSSSVMIVTASFRSSPICPHWQRNSPSVCGLKRSYQPSTQLHLLMPRVSCIYTTMGATDCLKSMRI